MAARIITQETFDAVVLENMAEFDMSPEEALQEAIDQFTSQGVDLSTIVQKTLHPSSGGGDGNGGDDPAAAAAPDAPVHPIIAVLKQLDGLAADEPATRAVLHELEAAMTAEPAVRFLLGKNDALARVLAAAQHLPANDALGLTVLATLLEGQPDLVGGVPGDALAAGDNETVDVPPNVDAIMALLERAVADPAALEPGLRAVRLACVMHEGNRQAFVARRLLPFALGAVAQHAAAAPAAVAEAMRLLRVLTSDDDVRVAYGKAAEHTRVLVVDHAAIGVLLTALAAQPDLTASIATPELFRTLSQLAIRDECVTFCLFFFIPCKPWPLKTKAGSAKRWWRWARCHWRCRRLSLRATTTRPWLSRRAPF
jgi:hypothetical protein